VKPTPQHPSKKLPILAGSFFLWGRVKFSPFSIQLGNIPANKKSNPRIKPRVIAIIGNHFDGIISRIIVKKHPMIIIAPAINEKIANIR
jgi:hypothetical protein